MANVQRSVMARYRRRDLPPSPPHPASLQTIGGRRWPYAYLEYCQSKCGDPFTLYPLDMPPMVFLAKPEDLRAVLTADAMAVHPGAGGQVIAPLVGEQSFMLLEEDAHMRGRRIVAPAFHKRMLGQQHVALTGIVDRAVASWPLGSPVALHSRLRALTMTVILRIIFRDEPAGLVALHGLLMRMLDVTDSLLLQGPRLRHMPHWRGTWCRFVADRARVDAAIYQLIAMRRATGAGELGDLLDMLLAATNQDGSPLSPQQIRDHLMSMILAGHETTTGELAWALLMLAHHPHIQRRLAEDLADGSDDYLNATVHETLRHRPVFAFTIPREVVTPVEIGAWTYTPPVQLVACTYLMHHNPDLYPNPQAFCPERFLGAGAQSRTWLPWGGGRKHCLGRHFAMLEVHTVLRHVISSREVMPASPRIESPRWRSAIVVPRDGARVVLRGRRPVVRIFFGQR
jgi:cytochrome P450